MNQDKKRKYTRRVVPEVDQLLSVGQLAQSHGLCRGAIYKLIAEGTIKPDAVIGNRKYYSLSKFEVAKQESVNRLDRAHEAILHLESSQMLESRRGRRV